MHAKGIQGHFLHLLSDYLQGSVLGSILWNLNVDDLLQPLPETAAYADVCTLSHSFKRQDGHLVAAEFSQKLNLIKEWGERWQVNFVP